MAAAEGGAGKFNALTLLVVQETHSTPCKFEVQGDRTEMTMGNHIPTGNEWAVCASSFTMIGNCYNL